MEFNHIPTVPRWVSLKNIFRMVKNPIPVVEETMDKMGPTYFFHMGGKTKGMITKDLALVKHSLKSNHKNFKKSFLQTRDLANYIGRGLLTNTGSDWLRQRRLIQPSFSRKNIDALTKIMEEEVIYVLDEKLGTGANINLVPFSAHLTFRIIARALFSDDVSYAEIATIRNSVEKVQQMLIRQVRQPYNYWYFQLSGQISRHKSMAQKSRQMAQSFAERRIASGLAKDDLLQFLLDTRYEDTGEPMSMPRLADELIILMVAGHETTAQSLIWTLYSISQHTEVYHRLVEEIDLKKNNYFQYFQPDSYLMAVIKESMRMYPPAWVIDRVTIEDDLSPIGKIPKNTVLMNFIYGLHHDPEYWVDPSRFDPSRFLTQRKVEAYFPFGGGPRICIGSHFAYLELIITLVQLFSRYDLPEQKIPFPGIRPLITLQPATAVHLDFSKIGTLTNRGH